MYVAITLKLTKRANSIDLKVKYYLSILLLIKRRIETICLKINNRTYSNVMDTSNSCYIKKISRILIPIVSLTFSITNTND